jgi:hypothetical protein
VLQFGSCAPIWHLQAFWDSGVYRTFLTGFVCRLAPGDQKGAFDVTAMAASSLCALLFQLHLGRRLAESFFVHRYSGSVQHPLVLVMGESTRRSLASRSCAPFRPSCVVVLLLVCRSLLACVEQEGRRSISRIRWYSPPC